MRKILIAAAAAGVVIVGITYYLVSNLDSIVARGIERYGSEATGTAVVVTGVEISLGEGRGSIKGLKVENPEGFDARDAFLLEDITLDLDVKSLRADPIVIEEILVKAPVVNVQMTGSGSSNIDELRRNVLSYAGGEGAQGEGSGREKRIRILRFVFEEGRIVLDASAMNGGTRTLVLPELRLDDIGGDGGAEPGKIPAIILTAIAKNAASEMARSGIEKVKDDLEKSAKEKAKSLLDRLGD